MSGSTLERVDEMKAMSLVESTVVEVAETGSWKHGGESKRRDSLMASRYRLMRAGVICYARCIINASLPTYRPNHGVLDNCTCI